MVDDIASGDLAFVDGIVGKHRGLHRVGGICRATTVFRLVANDAAVVGIRDVAVGQRLPSAIDFNFPTTRALVGVTPIHGWGRQVESLASANACRRNDGTHNGDVVHRHLNGSAIGRAAIVFGIIADPIAVAGILHIVVVEGVVGAALRGRNLPALAGNRRTVVLYRGRGEAETATGADSCWRGRRGNRGRIVHVDLHRIADVVAAVVAHLVMEVPVVVGGRYVQRAERLVGAVRGLADFPSASAVAIVGRNDDLQIIASADGGRGLQRPRDFGGNVHCQLSGRGAIDKTTTAFHHVADVPAIA